MITDEDRKAALKIFAMIFGNGHSATYTLARSDRHFLFDELTRHRELGRRQGLEEAAGACENHMADCLDDKDIQRRWPDISSRNAVYATAIRKLGADK